MSRYSKSEYALELLLIHEAYRQVDKRESAVRLAEEVLDISKRNKSWPPLVMRNIAKTLGIATMSCVESARTLLLLEDLSGMHIIT